LPSAARIVSVISRLVLLVAGTDVVDLADLALRSTVHAGAVVEHEQPVAHVEAVAVQRHLAAVEQVVTKNGMSFSGNWYGPNLLLRAGDHHRQVVRLVVAERDQVGPAFAAEYGERGCSGSVSTKLPSSIEP
jgi:hypothetical protein